MVRSVLKVIPNSDALFCRFAISTATAAGSSRKDSKRDSNEVIRLSVSRIVDCKFEAESFNSFKRVLLASTDTAKASLLLVNALIPKTATEIAAEIAAIIGTVDCRVIAPVVTAANKPATAPAIPRTTKILAVKATVIVPAWTTKRTTPLSVKSFRTPAKSPTTWNKSVNVSRTPAPAVSAKALNWLNIRSVWAAKESIWTSFASIAAVLLSKFADKSS